MNNLFKNTLRSLKNSKVAVVGLTFLVFLAVGIFTLLSSTTSNVTNEYANITKKANLHDITINEKYNVGNIRYDFIENIDAKDA
jgi:putative ABC transport system permease protein